MRRARFWLIVLLLVLLASPVGPRAASPLYSSPTPAATATLPARAAEIRFALVGPVTDVNVWALFDTKGYSYNNYAVRNEYWPRLYHLSIPDRNFEALAASGMPSSVQHDGNFFTATVPLRTDLTWTDGAPFIADDVAFTVNTALDFQLGFDWHDYYNPDYLDHAEAVDEHTVKFYFKKQPNVGVWQYGALQGPVVQKDYWSPKIAASAALLPPDSLAGQIESLKAKLAVRQQRVDASNQALAAATADQVKQIQTTLTHQQNDVNETSNDLTKAQSDFDSTMNAARESLYALDDKDEPTLGNWMPAGEENGEWINEVNPAHPFGKPKFDRVVYKIFINEGDAVNVFQNFQNNDVNMILVQGGDSPAWGSSTFSNFSSDLHVFIFNQVKNSLTDIALHQAIACLIWRPNLNGISEMPLASFVLPGNDFWRSASSEIPCADISDQEFGLRLKRSIQILRSAGYKWDTEPSWNDATNKAIPGKGLVLLNGQSVPPATLVITAADLDQMQIVQADYIKDKANLLGIPMAVQYLPGFEELRYAVFSSHQYDMAIIGWRVSEYPGYLCDWFGDGNPFGYHSDRLQSACEALNLTTDLDEARKQVFEIQSVLTEDLPFIPLYSGLTYDAYRNISYPFPSVLGGLSGVYGAPSLAIPAP